MKCEPFTCYFFPRISNDVYILILVCYLSCISMMRYLGNKTEKNELAFYINQF